LSPIDQENSSSTFSGSHGEGTKALGGKVYISTYGCQMNVNDSERMMTLLEMMNYSPALSPDQADLIIVNSCSIREKPVHKVHSEVGRYRVLKKKNPHLKIGVSGCVAQQEKSKLMKDVPLIDFVFGTDAIDELPEIISQATQGEKVVRAKFEHQRPYHIETMVRNPGVSTFVNITKGCDNFCTFCVVPFTRGRERSRPMVQILDDINRLVDRGVKEVTLVGQNVNSYTSDCGAGFGDLMKSVAQKTGIERIRFTTPHPKDFNKELMEIMQENRDKVMDYIHLPLQSGNSEVLERMNRGYTREQYIELAHMILKTMPGSVLSTDIIVGFPGETREQFEDTLSLLDEVPFESIYAFAYSPRPFTKAARFEEQLTDSEKNLRLRELFEKHNTLSFAMAKKYVGQSLKVLVEEYHDGEQKAGRCFGRSTQNKSVHFDGGPELVGKTVDVIIDQAFPSTLYGTLREGI
tara:strand:+ start:85777 stop:87168 length:1392 start_codon:yes stop_codon:yes gene_type:complete